MGCPMILRVGSYGITEKTPCEKKSDFKQFYIKQDKIPIYSHLSEFHFKLTSGKMI
jgi:hypothetical protein